MNAVLERSASEHTILERLVALVPGIPRREVAGLVRQCRADLAGSPAGAMPELVERLARQRLIDSMVDLALDRTGDVPA